MEEYEIAYASAMDDTDPLLVKEAFRIGEDKTMTYEQKADAIWKLFQDRKKKQKK
jgi:hypothetical protein